MAGLRAVAPFVKAPPGRRAHRDAGPDARRIITVDFPPPGHARADLQPLAFRLRLPNSYRLAPRKTRRREAKRKRAGRPPVSQWLSVVDG
jgi:hypothetical protein